MLAASSLTVARETGCELHGDGVVGVARDVPAGLLVGMGEESAGAGDVLFGADGVDLVVGFVALVWNGQKAEAVDGGGGSSEARNHQAQVIPGEIQRIHHEKEQSKRSEESRDKTRGGCGLGERRHRLLEAGILPRESTQGKQ